MYSKVLNFLQGNSLVLTRRLLYWLIALWKERGEGREGGGRREEREGREGEGERGKEREGREGGMVERGGRKEREGGRGGVPIPMYLPLTFGKVRNAPKLTLPADIVLMGSTTMATQGSWYC